MSEEDKKAALIAAKRKAIAKKQAQIKAGTSNPAPSPSPASGGGALAKRGILKVDISDEKELYTNYMPFVKGCGLFFPMDNHEYRLGDTAFLMLTIVGAEKKYNVSAKVVWINPQQRLGKRLPGVGFQINGKDTESLKHEIERILGKRLHSPLPTATM